MGSREWGCKGQVLLGQIVGPVEKVPGQVLLRLDMRQASYLDIFKNMDI